jgi:hypothetical protein
MGCENTTTVGCNVRKSDKQTNIYGHAKHRPNQFNNQYNNKTQKNKHKSKLVKINYTHNTIKPMRSWLTL